MKLLLSTLLLGAPAFASAQEVALAPSKDNTLYQSFNGLFSNALGHSVFVGTNNESNKRRAVMAFDVAGALPAGATITAVTLRLECDSVPQNFTPTAQSLHRLLADWGEGTSNPVGPGGIGAPSTPGDATWRHTFFPDQEWLERGGDFELSPSATTVVGDIGVYQWSSAELVSDVQSWLDAPLENFGWLIKDDLELDQSARRYGSRENPSAPPRLLIAFDAPAIGAPFCTPAQPNSSGLPARLALFGSPAVALNLVHARATQLPPERFGYVLASRASDLLPAFDGSQGTLCLASPRAKFGAQTMETNSTGSFEVPLDLAAFPLPGGAVAVLPGESWYFQAWYRDANPGLTSNFTDGVVVTFE